MCLISSGLNHTASTCVSITYTVHFIFTHIKSIKRNEEEI